MALKTDMLMTFIGRTARGEHGYRRTVYRFDDGACNEVAFFGWALQQHLQAGKMLILGTAGSMWDHLFEGDIDLGDNGESERLALIDAVEKQQVEQAQLDPLSDRLSRHLGYEVRLVIIPYCINETEQSGLLRIMSDHVEPGSHVHIDVTHGFRHLPMLALMAALYLRQVRNASIGGIWYGAFDPDTGNAPVHNLAGLMYIADWIQALSAYESDGNYGVFAPLLPAEVGEPLINAAFFESINRPGPARSHVRKVLGMMTGKDDAGGVAGLFYPELARRLQWAREDRFYQRQRSLAFGHLERRQYLEAVLTAYEAFISKLTYEQGGQIDNPDQRAKARDKFDRREKQQSSRSRTYIAWDTLRRLRNAMVHGTQAKGEEVQRAMDNAASMHELLTGLFDTLFKRT